MVKIFKIIIFNLFLLFISLPTHCQEPTQSKVAGIPYIQKIYLQKYGIENQNISIAQDTNGILFIGNSNGILEFNGFYWELLETPSVPLLTQHNHKIYFGTYNQLGYLEYGPEKKRQTLIKSAGSNTSQFGQPRKIFSFSNNLCFVANNELIVLQDTTKKLQLRPHTTVLPADNKGLFLYHPDEGLSQIDPNQLSQKIYMPRSKLPGNIETLTPMGDSLLVTTDENKLGFVYQSQFFSFPTQADSYLNQSSITDVVVFEKQIYIGTQSGGVVILNLQSKSCLYLNESYGLFDSKVNNLFIDHDENMWVLHDGGLSRIEISSGLTYYNHFKGIKGNVNNIKEFNDRLYLTSSKGVFILENYKAKQNQETTFLQVNGIHANSYDLYNFNGELVVSTQEGIYKILGNHAYLFYNKFRKQFNSVIRYKKNPNLLIIGKEDGISVVRYANGLFIYQGDIKGIPHRIKEIVEDQDGNLWVSTAQKGLFIVSAFDSYSNSLTWENYRLQLKKGDNVEWKKLYATSRGVYISASTGLFLFDTTKKELYRDPVIPEEYHTNWIFPIIEDRNQNIWFNIVDKDQIQGKTLLVYSKDGSKEIIRLPLNQIKNFSINTIQPEKENVLWIGGTDGLMRMDITKMHTEKSKGKTLINKVLINNDSLVYVNYHSEKQLTRPPKLAFSNNHIKFEFSATNYRSESNMLFTTKLDGYDKTWSEFNKQHFKEYRNLREGKYTFKLKAKDIYGQTSRVISFPFEIEPPIYRTWYAYMIYLVFIGFVLFIVFKLRAYYFAKEKFKLENIINERTEEVLLQKEKADNLIERLLPKETVKELKSGRKAGPYHYNMVTVLFGDIKGFTKITERLEELNALELLDKLDRYFLEFDSIAEKYNIEKIKTIGDAYMCAGGIPEENHTNPVEVIVAAMEMQSYMKKMKQESGEDKNIWDLRIGVDTGPVIAGVIGRNKVTYDIWGTTVNMASRMEASGEPGKINITGNTYMMVKDFFICKYRGRMPVKNKGDIDMYFVESLKPQFTETLKGLKPNKNFYIQLQLLRLNDLEEVILEKLDKGLPADFHYHNVKHTIDVVTQVELIGKSENVSDDEILLLKTAALFHDIGHLINYDNHEEESVRIATHMLPKYNYSKEQIDKIAELIMATKMPPQPKNLLEKIMCDADLDYLGRTDFVPVAFNLFKELKEKKKISSFEEWKRVEIAFIKQHSYFTKTAQDLREVNKRRQLEKIMKEMEPREETEED